ncbi:MAG: GNAT family N-acetyltransferase [Candidatus Nanoarchaeia archaeon]|nr:GNAT family N-acetyltransferase [Candidatus Nanoarchaeia archaeon]MDD5238999.1 GNAT family N-acetyltransferase [Candidatus Nanoarchaeia archaeon]
MIIAIEEMKREDMLRVAKLNKECFPTDNKDIHYALRWVDSCFSGKGRAQYSVAKEWDSIVGYVLFKENGGFREDAVLELEQIGVTESYRGLGVGTKLIQDALKSYVHNLKADNRKLKCVMVTTGTSNEAQKLYKKAMGAEPACTIPELYEGDELVMIARKEGLEKKLGIEL